MSEVMSGTLMGQFGPLMILVCTVLIIVPFWFIFRKAGYPQWLGVLMIVPVANIAMLYFLAFSDWPGQREKETKQS